MNLLLLEDEEIRDGAVELVGRRAHHLITVLRAEPGKVLRAGVINRGFVEATVVGVLGPKVTIQLAEVRPAPPPRVTIALAVPRPKALSRVVSAAASFGISQLVLFNAWRVDKSYFDSPRLVPERLLEDALLGCEQGVRVHLPKISVIARFMQFVEEWTPTFLERDTPAGSGDTGISGAPELIALHPHALPNLGSALADTDVGAPVGLVFGPEGGFIPAELTSLQTAGYRLARLETGPLKTEVALSAALGQLLLLRPW